MSWTSRSQMYEDINKLKMLMDHLLYAEGGQIAQINDKLTAIENRLDEIDKWRDGLLKHITVSITAPASGATLAGDVTVTATATDTLGHSISKLEFFLDNAKWTEDTASPYSVTLNTKSYSNATHKIKVIAYCTTGGWGSAEISATIDNIVPTGGTTAGGSTASYGDKVSVQILSPTPGSIVPIYFNITCHASCSAGHPISSVTCKGQVGRKYGENWIVPGDFTSKQYQKQTFIVIATCEHGTKGQAAATYYNADYAGGKGGPI